MREREREIHTTTIADIINKLNKSTTPHSILSDALIIFWAENPVFVHGKCTHTTWNATKQYKRASTKNANKLMHEAPDTVQTVLEEMNSDHRYEIPKYIYIIYFFHSFHREKKKEAVKKYSLCLLRIHFDERECAKWDVFGVCWDVRL